MPSPFKPLDDVESPTIVFATLLDLGSLAVQLAQIVELGAANVASGDDGYRFNGGRVQRERALHAHAEGYFADQEALADAGAGTAQNHALEGLGAGAVAFDHSHVDPNGVAGAEVGNVLAELAFLHEIESLHIRFSFRPCAQATSVVGAVKPPAYRKLAGARPPAAGSAHCDSETT